MAEGEAQLDVVLEPGFDPRPNWLKKFMEEVLVEAKAAGWYLEDEIVFYGPPWIDFREAPQRATWKIDRDDLKRIAEQRTPPNTQ
jgi:hypothetical protein